MIKNKIISYLLTVVLGIVSGIIGGGLGLGATTIALPGFILLGLVPNLRASVGTTLIASPLSWSAAYNYYKSGNSDLVKGIIYAIFYIIAAYFGSLMNLSFSEITLNYMAAFIHSAIGLFFLYLAIS